MSGIGAVVKVVDSYPCRWGSIHGKSCSILIVSSSKGLSLCFMCSDQHVKYRMPRGFLLSSSLLLDYHVKQYIHITQVFILLWPAFLLFSFVSFVVVLVIFCCAFSTWVVPCTIIYLLQCDWLLPTYE